MKSFLEKLGVFIILKFIDLCYLKPGKYRIL